ncbi:hypothetical protein BZA70DRAFT_198456 [Myxozyma melibiosi]|uniref:Transcription factor TFIIIC complex subunit Tfc6 n=1 Tax=Myxozyma melibiosi TaxID=54550 RepID=A0ABR1F2F6_9ASCO
MTTADASTQESSTADQNTTGTDNSADQQQQQQQQQQPVKRGRGRPRKYPLPEGYVPPPPKPKPPRKPRELTALELEHDSEERQNGNNNGDEGLAGTTTPSGRPRRRATTKSVDYKKLEDGAEILSAILLDDDEEVPAEAHSQALQTPVPGKRRRGRPPKDPINGPVKRPPPKRARVDVEEEDGSDEEFVAGGDEDEGDDDFAAAEEEEEDDDVSGVEDEAEDDEFDAKASRRRKQQLKSTPSRRAGANPPTQRQFLKYSSSAESRMQQFFGPKASGLLEGARYRNKWVNELTVLRRSLLDDPESTVPVLLESAGFNTGLQITSDSSVQQARELGFVPSGRAMRFDIGYNDALKQFTIAPYETVEVGKLTDGNREGLIMNVGGYPTACEWAPSSSESDTQYLAIPVISKADELQNPVFHPRTYPSSIQIWEFTPSPTPSVRLALCLTHNWGTPKSLSWCPVARSATNRAILGGVFCDESVRLIAVPDVERAATRYVHVQAPFLQVSLPGMSIYCFTWIDPHTIAVGATNGYVATFNVSNTTPSTSSSSDISTSLQTTPLICTPVHHSLIFDIKSCGPQLPHLLVTTSADGYVRTLDTRDARTCGAAKTRIKGYAAALAVHAPTQLVISTDDGTATKISPARAISRDLIVTRHDSGVTALATSPAQHPFLAAGGADGAVVVCNLAAGLVSKSATYQNWPQIRTLKLEVSTIPAAVMRADGAVAARVQESAVETVEKFRFVEGYKAETIGSAAKGDRNKKKVISPSSICVTAVSWCGERRFGGWYAAGFANGCVRIDNFAVE